MGRCVGLENETNPVEDETMRKLLLVMVAMTLPGCAVVAEIWKLASANILGIMPKEGFSDPDSQDYGKVVMAVAGESVNGLVSLLPMDELTILDPAGDPAEIEETTEVHGADAGSLVLLVDGSGSMAGSDPERLRVTAVDMLSAEMSECSENWSQSLFEFTTAASAGRLRYSRKLADFGSDAQAMTSAAEALDEAGGTPLWDAAHEIMGDFKDAADAHEASLSEKELAALIGEGGDTNGYARTIVVISDGADTDSSKTVEQVIQSANNKNIRVHSIGVGAASDANLINLQPRAIRDLRKLSLETDGYYGYVDSIDDLPKHAKAIAASMCDGYEQLVVKFPQAEQHAGRVWASLEIANSGISVPFTFSAP
jgi:hypothetical protein